MKPYTAGMVQLKSVTTTLGLLFSWLHMQHQSRSKLLGNGQANFNKLTLTSINYFRVTFEPVTFARCAFIIALRNIALDGYLDTSRNI